jgi:hypothetical protein
MEAEGIQPSLVMLNLLINSFGTVGRHLSCVPAYQRQSMTLMYFLENEMLLYLRVLVWVPWFNFLCTISYQCLFFFRVWGQISRLAPLASYWNQNPVNSEVAGISMSITPRIPYFTCTCMLDGYLVRVNEWADVWFYLLWILHRNANQPNQLPEYSLMFDYFIF